MFANDNKGDEMGNSALSETTVAARVPKSLKEALVKAARRRPATLSQVIREYLAKAVNWQVDDEAQDSPGQAEHAEP